MFVKSLITYYSTIKLHATNVFKPQGRNSNKVSPKKITWIKLIFFQAHKD